jgi:predicted lipoprotein
VVVVPWGGRRAITFKQEGMLAKASVAKLQCPGPAYKLIDEHRKQVRVFGGQVDAADSSRFSFRFEVDGKSGWMDLRLQDGDLVKYEIRRPPGAPTGKG